MIKGLETSRIKNAVISTLLMLGLFLSAVSSSHATMLMKEQDHSTLYSNAQQTHHEMVNDQNSHQSVNVPNKDCDRLSNDVHEKSDSCCAAFCAVAIIGTELSGRHSMNFRDRFILPSASLVTGEPASLHRPPNA